MQSTLRIAVAVALFIGVGTPASGQPAAATLISPAADVSGSTVAFTWTSAPTATWYHLWLGRSDSTFVMEQWYTAEHAGCAAGGTCTITVTPPIDAGAFIWYIRTWAPSGYGPWSLAHMFTVNKPPPAWSTKLPPSRRFTVVLDGLAVLDNETGLVWQRTPSTAAIDGDLSRGMCIGASTGSRAGWRLPTAAELRSLIDVNQSDPSLPPGHPFVLPADTRQYWSDTQSTATETRSFVVDFTTANVFVHLPSVTNRVWCVRGASAAGS
jgi:hypothetical protein